MTPLQSLVASGTKLWLDSVDPDEVATQPRARGDRAPRPTRSSSPTCIKTGRFDADIKRVPRRKGLDDEAIAWAMTDKLVEQAQDVFLPVWERDEGRRRLRQLRARPAAGRPGRNMPRRGADGEVHRAGQEVVGRAQEPHDQGAGHAGRARRRSRSWPPPASRSTSR